MLNDDARDTLNHDAPDDEPTPPRDDTSERITRWCSLALLTGALVSLALNIYDAHT